MSLCINPNCPEPAHPSNSHHTSCQACGAGLILQSRYRVMRLLSNSSGFGMVYEAYQQDQPKILKVLRPDRSEDPKILHLFQKEAEVLSRLHHPGVPLVETDGYFTIDFTPQTAPLHCIVMEKIDGPNLLQWMQQQGNHPIGERQAFQWLFQLAEVLRRIHQHNYFHRDIKPDNIMLRSTGQLVLVDFGAAREMSQTYLAQISSLGVTTISSAGYTPPEQEQGQAVPQSDFFALGRTIIFLVTGRSPNDTALYDPMVNAFNWRSHAPQISDEFANLLDTLIAPRVVDRPKTAQEILDRLHQFMLHQFTQQTNATLLYQPTEPPEASGTTQVGGFKVPAHALAQSNAPSPTPPIGSAVQSAMSAAPKMTHWTGLIVGGFACGAIALIGAGSWWRQRAVAPSPADPVPEAIEPTAPQIPAELLRTYTAHQHSVNALKLMSDERRFLSASADNTIRLWDLSTGEVLQTFSGHDTFVNAIALSPDERTLYSGSADGLIYAWNTRTGEQAAAFEGHDGPINALDRNPDGRFLVSGASDGTLKVWDANTQALLSTLEGHSGAINTLLVTNDGQRIISGGTDRTIRIWDLQTGELLKALEGHDSYINAIAASPDGRYLFSASADKTLKRWNLETGEVLDTLKGHTSYVNALALSRDGQTLSSGSADETIRQWSVSSGKSTATYTGFGMPIDHILLPSDQQFVTASRDNPAIKNWITE